MELQTFTQSGDLGAEIHLDHRRFSVVVFNLSWPPSSVEVTAEGSRVGAVSFSIHADGMSAEMLYRVPHMIDYAWDLSSAIVDGYHSRYMLFRGESCEMVTIECGGHYYAALLGKDPIAERVDGEIADYQIGSSEDAREILRG